MNKEDTYNFCDLMSDCRIVVDTGSSGIGVPRMYYEDLLAILTEDKSCVGVICENVQISDFPSLEVELMESGSSFPLKSSDYVICSGNFKCSIRIQQSAGLDWILGDAFISVYYTLFDVQNSRIGFACNGSCTGGNTVHANDDKPWSNTLGVSFYELVRMIPFIFMLFVGLYLWIF